MTIYSKCVGCGHCCITAQCPLSIHLYNFKELCPALYWDDFLKRHFCKNAKKYKNDLYIGEGCSSNLNSWRRNVKNRIGGEK